MRGIIVIMDEDGEPIITTPHQMFLIMRKMLFRMELEDNPGTFSMKAARFFYKIATLGARDKMFEMFPQMREHYAAFMKERSRSRAARH